MVYPPTQNDTYWVRYFFKIEVQFVFADNLNNPLALVGCK